MNPKTYANFAFCNMLHLNKSDTFLRYQNIFHSLFDALRRNISGSDFLNHHASSFQILHAISSLKISKNMHQIHEFEDMPSYLVNPTLVYVLHLKPFLHTGK